MDAMLPVLASHLEEGDIVVKNLFLKDKKGQLYLVSVGGERSVDLKALQKALGLPASASLRFASEDILLQELSVPQGAVTPLALLNRRPDGQPIAFVAEDALVACEGRLWVHPSDNAQTVGLRWADLERTVASAGVDVRVISLARGEP
ncbi:YbaK/aminoacyl-tRNA synthetase-associated domain-containing protein [Hyaloraphidium curvatum]|nr:YbaK/aminoacyl-tRNA synthetase-associated domain-containing protein [Hyaloraphidium curvatum]